MTTTWGDISPPRPAITDRSPTDPQPSAAVVGQAVDLPRQRGGHLGGGHLAVAVHRRPGRPAPPRAGSRRVDPARRRDEPARDRDHLQRRGKRQGRRRGQQHPGRDRHPDRGPGGPRRSVRGAFRRHRPGNGNLATRAVHRADIGQAGRLQLAFGDIFGGNAFLPVLFLLAVLVSGKAVLPNAHASDIYLTGLGALLPSSTWPGWCFARQDNTPASASTASSSWCSTSSGVIGLVAQPR